MASKAEVLYRSIVRSGFKIIADEPVGRAEVAAWLKREEAARLALGEVDATRVVDEEAKTWRGARQTCPWCGGDPRCST